jgi:hypothetical protein
VDVPTDGVGRLSARRDRRLHLPAGVPRLRRRRAAREHRALTNVVVDAEAGVWWNLCEGALEDALAEVVEVLDA